MKKKQEDAGAKLRWLRMPGSVEKQSDQAHGTLTTMPFSKGKSGNPTGRPRGSENRDKPFKKALMMEIAQSKDHPKALRKVARALLDKAIVERDMPAIREVADRMDGKVTAEVEMTGKDGAPIILQFSELDRGVL